MKKVLFATTALVAFAGAAAAEVAVSGSAELGIADDGSANENIGFWSSVDVRFSMTGESDNGLSFGATIDLDDALEVGGTGPEIGDNNNNDSIDYTIFVSGAFGTVTFGDTDGAMDWALTEGGNVGNPGSIADNETAYAGYTGSYLDGSGDGMIMRYEYSFGDYAAAISVEQGPDATGPDGETGYSLGFKGSVAGLAFGVAYQEYGTADLMGVSVGYGFGNVKLGLMYATGEAAPNVDDDRLQLGVGYSAGALSLHANYAERELGNVKSDGFGLAAKYDFGGGLGAHFAYGTGSVGAAPSVDTWSLGLSMSF